VQTIEEQMKLFLDTPGLREQLKGLKFGAVAFHVRDGKVFKILVEKSVLFTGGPENVDVGG